LVFYLHDAKVLQLLLRYAFSCFNFYISLTKE